MSILQFIVISTKKAPEQVHYRVNREDYYLQISAEKSPGVRSHV
nr:hypothetical protein [Microcystis sp. M_OC_Ca_00000000_C217Col]